MRIIILGKCKFSKKFFWLLEEKLLIVMTFCKIQFCYLTAKILNLAFKSDHGKMLMLPVFTADCVLGTAGFFSMWRFAKAKVRAIIY